MKLKRKAGAQGEGLWGPQVPLASHTGTQGGVSRDPFPQIKLWGFLCGSYVKGFSLFFLSLRPCAKPLVTVLCCHPFAPIGQKTNVLYLTLQQLGLPGHPPFHQAQVHVPPCKPPPLFPVQLPSLLSAVLAPDPSSERAGSLCGLCLVMGGWGEGI